MDGFLRAGANDLFSIGYYEEKDLPFYAALARNYTTCDHYFAPVLGPTFPNRMFLYAAQTDRIENSLAVCTLPTIFDRLAAAGVSHTYYFSNVPYVALWKDRYLGISKLHSECLAQARNGTLPAVSFVDPRYTIRDDGTGNDDHPHSDIRSGERFLFEVFEAISSGPSWASTVLIVNFDEWGGFFDHVPPPRVAAANRVDPDIVGGKTLLGFRLPVVVASPFSRGEAQKPRISSLVYDHTSVLKLIEWRWELAPLSPRDASDDIHNLAYALNLNQPETAVPQLPEPFPPASVAPCFASPVAEFSPAGGGVRTGVSTSAARQIWRDLQVQAATYGFQIDNPDVNPSMNAHRHESAAAS